MHRSTLHAVTELSNKINNNLNNKKKTIAIFIDFRKAFDCVQYQLLLEKLKKAGLGNDTLKWFESYLKDRKQTTKVNGKYSMEKLVRQGVPQGSILGPLLYILYANDIKEVIK